mmetsp:Transcript_112858/g.313789  ORF Transcript_112858/g.313789 Transcript_112858/m.313789 type:complete len:211 (-) Transcript_112858:88-720(-)
MDRAPSLILLMTKPQSTSRSLSARRESFQPLFFVTSCKESSSKASSANLRALRTSAATRASGNGPCGGTPRNISRSPRAGGASASAEPLRATAPVPRGRWELSVRPGPSASMLTAAGSPSPGASGTPGAARPRSTEGSPASSTSSAPPGEASLSSPSSLSVDEALEGGSTVSESAGTGSSALRFPKRGSTATGTSAACAAGDALMAGQGG